MLDDETTEIMLDDEAEIAKWPVVKVDSLKILSVDASGVHLIYRVIFVLLTKCHGSFRDAMRQSLSLWCSTCVAIPPVG